MALCLIFEVYVRGQGFKGGGQQRRTWWQQEATEEILRATLSGALKEVRLRQRQQDPNGATDNGRGRE